MSRRCPGLGEVALSKTDTFLHWWHFHSSVSWDSQEIAESKVCDVVISVLETKNNEGKKSRKGDSRKMGGWLLKKDFNEIVNWGSVCYHIIDSVKNAGRCLFFSANSFPKLEYSNSYLCVHDTSSHPSSLGISRYPHSTRNRNKLSCPWMAGDMTREQGKRRARSALLKHAVYRGGYQISEMSKWLIQSHMAMCSLFHSSSKLWIEFLQRARLLRRRQEVDQDSQEMLSGLEAPAGTSDPNPVPVPYIIMESQLSFPGSEENENGTPICISHSVLQVCYGLHETTSAGLGAPRSPCISLFLWENVFRLSNTNHLYKLSNCRVSELENMSIDCLGFIEATLGCPTSKTLAIS